MNCAITLKPGRDSALTMTALAVPVVFAWTYVLLAGRQMTAMPNEWSLGNAAIVFIMWAVMMIAMMLPSAAKVILLAATLDNQHSAILAMRHTGKFASNAAKKAQLERARRIVDDPDPRRAIKGS